MNNEQNNRSEDADILKNIPLNEVQLLNAFRIEDLTEAARKLGHDFVHIPCFDVTTQDQILKLIATTFHLPEHVAPHFDALADCLTDLDEEKEVPGFIVVLEKLPNTSDFDTEKCETLLDVFRDVALFWMCKAVPFRVFYSCE